MSNSKTRVVGYIRVSTEGQADSGVSLDAQEAKLKGYATAMDLELVEIIRDAGVSAKTLKRPGLTQALALLEAGDVAGLVVVKLDRLTRSVRDLGWLLDPARFGNAWELLSVTDSIDTRSAGGRLVLHVLGSVSEWERSATAERTKAALAHIRNAEGATLGGEALGWKRTNERDAHGRLVFERDAAESATVARIRELRSGGCTLRDIAGQLTAEGRPTKRGGKWAAATVARILKRAAPESQLGLAAE